MARGAALVSSGLPGMEGPSNPDYDEPDLPPEEEEHIPALDEEELVDEPEPLDPEAARQADFEARARAQGWRPLNEYRGTPGKWVDAETFLTRGESFLPFVQKDLRETRESLQRVEHENTLLRSQLTEQGEVLKELRQFARNSEAAGYNRVKAELEQKMRTAVAEGDAAVYDDTKQQYDSLVEGRAERAAEARTPPQPPQPSERPQPSPQVAVAPEVQSFMAANAWFTADRVLNAAMIDEHVKLSAEAPGMELAANLEEAKRRVMAQFPQKFGRQASERHATPRSRTVVPPSRGGAPPAAQQRDSFMQIVDPAEREVCRNQYARMKAHQPDMTAKEYVALYLNPHADVLEIQRAQRAAKGKF